MNKFDQHIKDKLTEHQLPPIDAWDNIEQLLEQPTKNKKRLLWVWFGSAAASITLIGGIFSLMNLKNNQQPNIVKTDGENNPVKNSIKKEQSSVGITPEIDVNNSGSIQSFAKQIDQKFDINPSDFNSTSRPSYPPKDFTTKLEARFFNQSDAIFNVETNILNSDHTNITQNRRSELKNNIQNIAKEDASTPLDEPSLESILANNEKKSNKNKTLEKLKIPSKLLVSTFASPIKMLDQQSILSNNFNSHPITSNVTLAYGAKIAYQINDKFRIRAGVSKVGLDQVTNNVTTSSVTATSIASNTFQPIIETANTNNHIRYSSEKTVLANANNFPNLYYFDTNNTMNHQLEFVEIPIELEYKLLQKNKFNVSAIAGGSYYILSKNELTLTNNNQLKEKIGSATNVNKTSYSTNAAVKLEYQIGKNVNLQLEPNYRLMLNQVKDVKQNSASLFGVNLGVAVTIK